MGKLVERTVEWALNILRRYEQRINAPEYRKKHPHRPRGNPQDVREAVAFLRGYTLKTLQCDLRLDGCTNHNIQLHHLNGNWLDYSPENLVWACKRCHNLMEGKVDWSFAKTDKVEAALTLAVVPDGQIRPQWAPAIEFMRKEYPQQLKNVTDKQLQRWLYTRKSGKGKSSYRKSSSTVKTVDLTMLLAIMQLAKKHGITIT